MTQTALPRRDAVPDVVADIERAMQSMARMATRLRVHERFAAEAGVTLDRAGAALLRALADDDRDFRLTELADRLGIEAPGVTRKVQRLEQDGYLTRCVDPDDRRACRLHLTARGRRTIEKLETVRRRYLAEVLTGWPAEDRVALARLLERFAADLVTQQEASR